MIFPNFKAIFVFFLFHEKRTLETYTAEFVEASQVTGVNFYLW